MENTVLALMAHPDDAEILCGGTLALLRRRGWDVHIATLAPGDCGSATLGPREISAIRRREGAAAAAVIDGRYHCLERLDLRIFYDETTLRDACGLLRRIRPRLVIAHSPSDYMADHEEASRIARAATFAAPIPNAPAPGAPASGPASPLGTATEAPSPCEAVPHLYYADPVEGKDIFGQVLRPSLVVDVGSAIETKLRMLAAHASQRDWLRKHHGVDEYLDSVRRWAQARGRLAGCEYAEGFRQHLGHGYPQDDLLSEALGGETKRI